MEAMPPPSELFSPKSPVTISSEHTISPLSPLHEHSALPMPQIAAPECSWSGEREKLYAQLRILKSQSSPPLVTPSFRLPVCKWYATGYLFYFIYFISYLFINLFVSFFVCLPALLSVCLPACLPVCLSVCLPVCLPARTYVCMYVYMYVCVHVQVALSHI